MILLLALAQIIVCADTTCSGKTNKDVASMQPTDLVSYCAASTPDRSMDCSNLQIIPWHSMNSYSRVLTDQGYYRVSEVPSGLVPNTPTTPPVTPPTATPVYDIQASWTAPLPDAIDGPATDYQLFYGLAGSSLISVRTGNVLAYTVKSPPPGYYELHILAYNNAGPSALSNAAYVQISAPSTPVTPPTTGKITETPGTWVLKQGSSNVQTGLASYDACKALAASKATTTPTKYLCNVSDTVVVSK